MPVAPKNFNLPWHTAERYWLTVFPKSPAYKSVLESQLKPYGYHASHAAVTLETPNDWLPAWRELCNTLLKSGDLDNVEVALSGGIEPPAEASRERRSIVGMAVIADSMWLGTALLEDRIMCYLQPVMNGTKIFGYESFARVKMPGGDVISGDKIVAAARGLGIEYMIDRHLHVQAINTFAASAFDGFLFVNFFPGFIHRPAIYLEGLSETVKSYNIIPKHIVLDLTNAETQRDMAHLKNVCDYARSKGYSLALDDIASLDAASKLIPEIKPDFVKLERSLSLTIDKPGKRDHVTDIVRLSHAVGATVIGEGIETQQMHDQLKELGVDLFQGYLFSPPMPVTSALKQRSASA